MPLEIILPIVVFGVTGIVLLVHFMGWTKELPVTDVAQAQEIWQADFPGEVVRDLVVDDDGHAALVTLADNRIGLIWAMGEDAAVRHLDQAPEVETTPDGLRLRLHDFTAPEVDLKLADTALRSDWARKLSAI